jgi:hypothetical protein
MVMLTHGLPLAKILEDAKPAEEPAKAEVEQPQTEDEKTGAS